MPGRDGGRGLFEQRGRHAGDLPADDDVRGVEDQGRLAQHPADGGPGGAQHPVGDRVAPLDRGGQAAEVLDREALLPAGPQDGGDGREGLDAAPLAAAAVQPVRVGRDVPQLARPAPTNR